MTDNEAIKLILEGDREKFGVLVEKYQQIVFRTVMGYLHNKDDADDLSQEVFIQVYQSLSRFRGESSFSTWIYRIAVNASLNRIRKSSENFLVRRFETLLGTDKKEEYVFTPADNEDPENILIREEHLRWLQKALDSLPESQRTAIILSKYDDLPQKEIAEIMNLTEGAVEALIQRAKKNLREKLSAGRKK